MKNNMFRGLLKLSWLMLAAFVVFTACKKDDDPKPPVIVLDGIYLTGAATGFTGLDADARMDAGRVEGEGFASNPRDGMYEKFIYLTAGNFSVVKKAGANETTYGWDATGAQVLDNEGNDEVDGDVIFGSVVGAGTAFNVTEAGFYHIIFDEQTSQVFYVKVTHWAVIGDATDLGWSGEFAMETKSLTATAAEFEVTNLTLRARGGFKFRYNSGWKITTDDFVIFANIGKGEGATDFLMGGGGFPYPTAGEGAYTVKLMWSLVDGWAFTTTRTGDVEPLPEYPDALYMIGDGVGGWEWDNIDLPMVPVHSNPQLFWKIVWMNAEGGFKFAPQKAWNGDFGKTGEATDGIYSIGGDNVPVPGTAGYYMVVVNLETDEIAVVDPKVYLIGNTIGSWDTAYSDGLFTVDNTNEVITITKTLAADELRMYAWFDAADWYTKALGEGTQVSWWQVEFMILDGVIEFRGTGNDQERVNVTAGEHTISLNFKEGTGTIE